MSVALLPSEDKSSQLQVLCVEKDKGAGLSLPLFKERGEASFHLPSAVHDDEESKIIGCASRNLLRRHRRHCAQAGLLFEALACCSLCRSKSRVDSSYLR